MEPVKEIGQSRNKPISFIAQIDFISRSHSPENLTHNAICVQLSSVNNQHVSPSVYTSHSTVTLEAAPNLSLSGDLFNKQNAISIETTGYVTDKLPEPAASHDQHYGTKFDDDMLPSSIEESRKNVKLAPIEKDDDLLQQLYQKYTVVGNVLPYAHNQTKTSTPVSSSSVNKSQRPLPRKACLVYNKEQYHLDHNLLSQPKANKYLVKVRTEISPGRYMAKLELHCSR